MPTIGSRWKMSTYGWGVVNEWMIVQVTSLTSKQTVQRGHKVTETWVEYKVIDSMATNLAGGEMAYTYWAEDVGCGKIRPMESGLEKAAKRVHAKGV